MPRLESLDQRTRIEMLLNEARSDLACIHATSGSHDLSLPLVQAAQTSSAHSKCRVQQQASGVSWRISWISTGDRTRFSTIWG